MYCAICHNEIKTTAEGATILRHPIKAVAAYIFSTDHTTKELSEVKVELHNMGWKKGNICGTCFVAEI